MTGSTPVRATKQVDIFHNFNRMMVQFDTLKTQRFIKFAPSFIFTSASFLSQSIFLPSYVVRVQWRVIADDVFYKVSGAIGVEGDIIGSVFVGFIAGVVFAVFCSTG